MNFENFKCRCSGIHKIMANNRGNMPITEKQSIRLAELESKVTLTEKMHEELRELRVKVSNSTKVILSDTCITYLMEVYAWETQGMIAFGKEVWEIDQLTKGKMSEDDSITLLSIVDGVLYTKNDERISNDFLSGEPDVFLGDNIMSADKIIDIKTAFDYPCFLQKVNSDPDPGYVYQLQGYCDISGAKEAEISHCLVDMHETMINDYRRKLFYKMDVPTEENPDFIKKWEIMERSMRFGNIPATQRVFKQKVSPFNDFERQKVYDRVKVCREWLAGFHERMQNLNKGVVLMNA